MALRDLRLRQRQLRRQFRQVEAELGCVADRDLDGASRILELPRQL